MRRKKIAILRANALGDFIFVLPALQMLRNHFPEAELFYLGKKMHKEFLDGHPGLIDKTIVIPPYPGVGESQNYQPDVKELNDFFTAMQDERFDVAMQLHGGGRYSNPFVLQLGATMTIGLGTPDAAPLDITIPYITLFSETLRYIEVVSYLTLNNDETADLTPTAKDIEAAKDLLENSNTKQPFAIISPGATDPRRRWPAENFASIIDFLVEKGWDVYINAIEEEKDIVDDVLKNLYHHKNVYNLTGRASLAALTGLISMAELVISSDSGPLHLAHILHTPAIGIYWVGNMITAMPLASANTYPLVSWTTICPDCGLECRMFDLIDNGCPHNTSFVAEISPEEVKTAIDILMKGNEKLPVAEAAGIIIK